MQAESAKSHNQHNQQNEIPKDYSLLRKFDLEAAKRGELMCNTQGEGKFKLNSYSTSLYHGKEIIDSIKVSIRDGDFVRVQVVQYLDTLRMLPLYWIEGKPVYKGDVLWRKDKYTDEVIQVTVESFVEQKYTIIGKHAFLNFEGDIDTRLDFAFSTLHWEKPKVKVQKEGWMNIYPEDAEYIVSCHTSPVYRTKEIADMCASKYRIDCVKVQWEVEE